MTGSSAGDLRPWAEFSATECWAALVDDEQPALLVAHRGRRARCVVDQRHLAKIRARPQHRERLLAHPGDVAADPDLALQDDVELVARIAVLEDLGPERVMLLGRDP